MESELPHIPARPMTHRVRDGVRVPLPCRLARRASWSSWSFACQALVFLLLLIPASKGEADGPTLGDIDVVAGGQVRGTVDPYDYDIEDNTQDWYRFTLPAAHTVDFRLAELAAGVGLGLCLYDESVGELIPFSLNLWCSSRATIASRFVFGYGGFSSDLQSGTYYIRVRARCGNDPVGCQGLVGKTGYLLTYGVVGSPQVHLSTTRLSMSEGDTGTYTVKLDTRPSGNVVVQVASDDLAVTVSPATLIFTTANWNTTQTVTVRAVPDDDADDETATLSHRVTGYGDVTDGGTVTVRVNDTDIAGLTVSPRRLEVDEGDTATYTVKLDTRPSDNVMVQTASDDPAVTVSPATLAFTTANWSTAQTVTVRAVPDDDADDETATLSHRVTGYGDVTDGGEVRISVNDADIPGVTLSTRRLELNEGETGTYTVKLRTRPSGDVTVLPESSDDGIVTVDPTTRRLTFTTANWSTAQTVTVQAVRVRDTDPETVTISHKVIDYGDVTDGGAVTVILGDATKPGVTFSTRRLELNEGETGTYTVKLRTRPLGNVTVQPASTEPDAVTFLPASLAFTTANWNTAQTVTVRAVPDNDRRGISQFRVDHRVAGYGNVTRGGAIIVRITYPRDFERKPGVIGIIKPIFRGIIGTPNEIIGRGRNRTVAIGVRGFRSLGGATLTLGGQTITPSDATSAAPLTAPDVDWHSKPSAYPEDKSWWSRDLGVDELLRSSAFDLTLGATEDGPSQLTLWGRGDLRFLDSKPGAGSRYDSTLKAGYLGVETLIDERWLTGLAMSRTGVATDYALEAGGSDEDGKLDLTLTSAYPYLRLAPDPRSEFWILLGAGWGEITNEGVSSSTRESSSVRTRMVAGGARWVLTTDGGVDLALLGDAGYGHLSSNSGPRLIDDLSVDSWQVRLGIEGSYTAVLKGGSSLTPFVEVAGRYDGDGDHEAGLEIASGLSWADPISGFGVEARGRVMVLHSTDNYREYGASLTARLSPGSRGEGLSLLLSPRLGGMAEGSDALWHDDAFQHASSSGDKAMSLNAQVGYGIRDTVVRGLLTPFTELDLGERGHQQVRMGMRFDRGLGLDTLSLELSGERRESSGSNPEHRVNLIGRLHF